MTKFEQIIARTIVSLSKSELKGVLGIYRYKFDNCGSLSKIELPDTITFLSAYAFSDCKLLTSVIVPKNVSEIGSACFENSDAMTTVRFEQPLGMAITLPTAGQTGTGTGMFYSKTARPMDVYTDNETIKNYAWASDNITATFYHLDGTTWS